MPILSLSLIFQIALVVHAVRSDKDRYWIYVILFIPTIGGLVYLIAEVLPTVFNRSHIDRGATAVQGIIAPGRQTKKLEENYHYSPTVENMRILAREYIRIGNNNKALELLQQSQHGPLGIDPATQLEIVRILLVQEKVEAARDQFAVLDIEQIEHFLKPKYYQRQAALAQASGDFDCAEAAHSQAILSSSELKYQFQLAEFYKQHGKTLEAEQLLNEIIANYKRMPSHAKHFNRQSVSQAKNLLRQLKS